MRAIKKLDKQDQ